MAKEKQTATDPAEQLGSLIIGENCTIGGVMYHRVPGGFVAVIGSTSCYIPGTGGAFEECGFTLELSADKPE